MAGICSQHRGFDPGCRLCRFPIPGTRGYSARKRAWDKNETKREPTMAYEWKPLSGDLDTDAYCEPSPGCVLQASTGYDGKFSASVCMSGEGFLFSTDDSRSPAPLSAAAARRLAEAMHARLVTHKDLVFVWEGELDHTCRCRLDDGSVLLAELREGKRHSDSGMEECACSVTANEDFLVFGDRDDGIPCPKGGEAARILAEAMWLRWARPHG